MSNTDTHTYIAFFNGKDINLEATSLYAAKQAAVAHFKPRKKLEHMVHVHLVRLAGETKPVMHMAVD